MHSGLTQELFDQAKSLYRAYKYLEAYELTKDLWYDKSVLARLDDPSKLLFASWLGEALGARKLSEALTRRVVKRFPDDAWVRFYHARQVYGFKHHYDLLRHYEDHPLEPIGDTKLDTYLHAQRCVNWAYVGEFKKAHEHLEQAFEYGSNPAWLHHQRARLLLYEDRTEEALADAERAFELKPRADFSVALLSDVLTRLKRYEEVAERSWEIVADGQAHSYRYVQTVMRNLGALVDRAGSKHEAAHRMLLLCDELTRTAPLADAQVGRSIRLSQIDAYLMNDQLDRAAELAKRTENAFYGKVFRFYRDRKPDARMVVVPHSPVLQDKVHCLPASVSVVLSCFGDAITQHHIGRELTMGGTSIHELTSWLREREYQVIHFMATEDSTRMVLEAGIPFVYHETYEASAHSMAMVGFDDRLGTFLIHDPGYTRLSQMVASSIGSGEQPIGTHGMIVLPKNHPVPPLPREWTEPVETYYDYHKLLNDSGLDAAEKRVVDFERDFSANPVARYLRADLHHRRGEHNDAQDILMELYREHPRCVYFRRLLLRVLRAQQNTALMRNVLHEIVRKGSVRGIKPDKKFRLPMATYKCQYADYVRMSADGLAEAHRYITMALQQEPGNGEPYHILADILLEEDRGQEAILAYRVASCLEPDNSHYAHACFTQMMRFEGRESALAFMHERAETLGRHPRGMDAWDDYVRALDEAGRPDQAVTEMRALLEVHGANPTARSYAARLFARLGKWELAWESVNELNSGENESLYLPAVTDLFWYQRELDPGLQMANRWIELEPGNRDARQAVLRFTRQLHDNAAAFEVIEKWFSEMPGNEMIENIYLDWLRQMDRRRDRIEVLRRRVERNPKDAWAWRALGFDYASEMTGSSSDVYEASRTGLIECIEKSKELSPGWGSSALMAELADEEGRGRDALDHWLEALSFTADYDHAMSRAWDLSSGLGGEVKSEVLQRLRQYMFARVEIDDTHFIYAVADRYGFEEAAELLLQLREQHPHSPELVSCRAWLVMNYSMGAPDLGTREDALADLQRFRQDHPAHRGMVLAMAEIHRRAGAYDDAVVLLREWVELHRDDLEVVRRLAQVYEEPGRYDDAAHCLERALEHCPGDEMAYQMQAAFFGRRNRLDEAVDTYRTGLEKLPENIWLREQFGDFCLQYGFDDLAVVVAREGTAVYPDGAYLWYQYGRALNRAEWTEDTTDPVVPLRKALELNSDLYSAADTLSVILVDRTRYAEALEVMSPFVDDAENSLYARARIAYIKRTRGVDTNNDEDRQTALGEAMALAEEAPDYEWIWRRLIEWIEEDKNWTLAKEIFCELPSVMQNAAQFRAHRLKLLRKAGRENIEADWAQLLEDFPRNEVLYNDCFDELWDAGKREQAIELLEGLRQRNLGNLWTDIRLIEAYTHWNYPAQVVDAARRVWLNPYELSMDNDNSVNFSWERIAEAQPEVIMAVAQDFVSLLGGKEPLRPLAIQRFCQQMAKMEGPRRRKVIMMVARQLNAPAWRRFLWWLRSLASEANKTPGDLNMIVMELLHSTGWANGMHFSCLIMAGGSTPRNVRVADRLRRLRPGIEDENTFVWGALGYVYFDHAAGWVLKNMANWRERPGAKSWHVTNYLVVHFRQRPNEAELRLRDSTFLLQNFGHDRNFYALAWLALDSAVRCGEFNLIPEIHRNYAMYLDRDKHKNEFFPNLFNYMPGVLPCFLDLARDGWSKELQRRFKRDAGRWKKIDWIYKAWKKMQRDTAQP